MAFILSIQFYFTQQTQEDIVHELTQMSEKIEKATTPDFIKEEIDDLVWKTKMPDVHKVLKRDSFEVKNDSLFRKKFEWSSGSDVQQEHHVLITSKYENEIDVRVVDKPVRIPPGMVIHKKADRVQTSEKAKNIYITGSDSSMEWVVREIEVNLNPIAEKAKSQVWKNFQFNEKTLREDAPNFTFVVPDFRKPAEPRLLRFNYSTAELHTALSKIRNKNIMITLTIFMLSIVAIMLITRKFLRPIDALKQSFERVVDGDLEVTVKNDTKDEIGRLTVAFNQMVSELRKNKEKEVILRRKERLASLGQLAAGVAHEIKNPLNAINLTIEHLGDTIPEEQNKSSKKYIATIQKEIRRLDKMVNNFLNYLRSEELDKKETDINGLIREIVHLYEREFEASHIEFMDQLTEPFILAVDGERLKTALVNIVLNAIQAMPRGGKLTLKTDVEKKLILIRDNGTGIARKDIENIFDLFYTTKSTGSGLGLPTAYKVIKAHGGDIRITSKVNMGTEVTILFS